MFVAVKILRKANFGWLKTILYKARPLSSPTVCDDQFLIVDLACIVV